MFLRQTKQNKTENKKQNNSVPPGVTITQSAAGSFLHLGSNGRDKPTNISQGFPCLYIIIATKLQLLNSTCITASFTF